MLWASGKTRNGTHETRVRGPYGLRPSRPPEPHGLQLEHKSADQPSRHGEGPCPDEQLRPVRHRTDGESRPIRHLWPATYMTQLADQNAFAQHWASITNPSQP